MNSPASLFPRNWNSVNILCLPLPISSCQIVSHLLFQWAVFGFAWCVSRGMKTWVKNTEMGMVRFMECALGHDVDFHVITPLFSDRASQVSHPASCQGRAHGLQYWLHCCLAMWFSVISVSSISFSVLISKDLLGRREDERKEGTETLNTVPGI